MYRHNEHILCRYFNTPGGCFRGDQCWFRHNYNHASISNQKPVQKVKIRSLAEVLNAKAKQRAILKAKQYALFATDDEQTLFNKLMTHVNNHKVNLNVGNILSEYVKAILMMVHNALILLWKTGPSSKIYSILLLAFVNLGFKNSCFTHDIIVKLKHNLNKIVSNEYLPRLETKNSHTMELIIQQCKANIYVGYPHTDEHYNHILSLILYSEKIDRLRLHAFDEYEFDDTDYIATILIVSMQKPIENAEKIWEHINKTKVYEYSDTESIDSDSIPLELFDYINGCRLDGKAWKSKYGEKLLHELIKELSTNYNGSGKIQQDYCLSKIVKAQHAQTQYERFELNIFNAWKDIVWKSFAAYMDQNTFAILMTYCQMVVVKEE